MTDTAPKTDLVARAPVRIGMVTRTVEETYRLAQFLAASGNIDPKYRDKVSDVFLIVTFGAELGLAPMQALQSIYTVNGRQSLYGDALLAVVMGSPAYVDHDEYFEVNGQQVAGLVAADYQSDETTAICTFVRAGKATPVTRRFSIGQARKAKLLGKSGPWTEYPDRMLQMRARAFAARDAFPDILRGISSAEEMRDLPIDVTPSPPVTVRRRSEAVPAMTEPAADPAPHPEGPSS